MRRILILLLLSVSVTAVLASAVGTVPASARTRAASGADPVLFGDQTVESTQDSNPAGVAQAWPLSNSTNGTAASISIYVDSANTATQLIVGLYADDNGSPGSLLASGSLSYPTTGAWNTISIGSMAVSSGKTYWLALLGASGTPYFRDRSYASCNSQGSAQSDLSSLPSTWSTGAAWGSCPVSAYVNGYLTTTTAAPVNTVLPTISGTAQQGRTLGASPGSWTGSAPIAYTYAWSDGATGSSDSLAAGDVGQNVSVTVTASNGAGSANATSASVGPVTASGGSASGGSGSVPCALTHAAGADGTSSCWATHTGVQAGTGYSEAQIEAGAPGFAHVNGPVTITQPGTVIDHEWINGCIAINAGANNVTIKNTLVTAEGDVCQSDVGGTYRDIINAGQDSDSGSAPTGLLIEDVTVDGKNLPGGTSGVTLSHGECLRCNVFGFIKNFTGGTGTAQNPMLFQDSYSHDISTGGQCDHENGFWIDTDTYVTLEHDYAIMDGGDGCVTGAISLQSDWGPSDHIIVDNSYGEGVRGMDFTGGCATSTTVTNNAFSSDNGYSGTDFSDYSNTPGITWSGNYVAETGAALSPGGGC